MAKKHNALGERMLLYENVNKHYLMPKVPVIVRIDGQAFHTLMQSAPKPFDYKFIISMVYGATEAMKHMSGCVVAYVQSDEVSFLFYDYKRHETKPWFNYETHKLISLPSSYMSIAFSQKYDKFGAFDGRAFNVPENDVANYFLYRARDHRRNAIQSVAQSLYSHKELNNKNVSQQLVMIKDKSDDFFTLPPAIQNGVFLFGNKTKIRITSTIKPSYEAISPLIKSMLIVEEQ